MEPKKETNQGNKHILIMVLCCLAPMLLVALLLTVGIGGVLPFLVILMCPLMHFLLMRGMHGKHGHEHSDQHIISTETSAKRLKQTVGEIAETSSTESAKLTDTKPNLTDRKEVERR